MSKKAFRVSVTKILTVELDLYKLNDEFWSDFNSSISDRGGPDIDYLAEHVGWNFVQGDTDFVEGIGPLKEMNISVREVDSEVEVEDAK